jgi:hypothetical protein
LRTAQFHRMAWDYERNTGVGKIHYEPLGIVAFFWEEGTPMNDVNFVDKNIISYYWQQHKRDFGVPLTHGCILDRDVSIVMVHEKKIGLMPTGGQTTGGAYAVSGAGAYSLSQNSAIGRGFFFSGGGGGGNSSSVDTSESEGVIYGIKELNLMIKVQAGQRYLAAPNGEWFEFDDHTPTVAYKELKSLLLGE